MKEIVIPKEKAVFWMGGNGRWYNEHGPFQHKKLIEYFNTSIRWDSDGFFVSQVRGDIHEKVYFRCKETALFAVDITAGDEFMIILNTRESIRLDPQQLYIKDDCLFMHYQETTVKFTDRSMMRLAENIEERDGAFYFNYQGNRHALQKTEA